MTANSLFGPGGAADVTTEDLHEDSPETPRPDPGFRIYVHRSVQGTSRDVIDITHAVMDIYDIAVNSMDFGSGFLSTEEVGNLRKLGEAIGAKRFDYQHDKCLRCGHDYQDHYWDEWGDKAHHCAEQNCVCTGYARPNP